jgi:hypothetical protein
MSDHSFQPPDRVRHRPPTVEDFPILFRMVAANIPLTEACRKLDIHYYTVQSRLASDKDLANEYMLAKSYRADALAEEAIEIAREVLKGGELKDLDGNLIGGVSAKAGKVAIETYQWAAAQLAPKAWGQSNTKTELTGKDGKDLNAGNSVIIFMLPDNGR